MLRVLTIFLLTAASSSSSFQRAEACTTFAMPQKNGVLVGKSYDWNLGAGLVMHNKRGMAKKAIFLDPTEVGVSWTSRYASLTFNQYGRELPNGGMNEKGLVVEISWLDSSRYPGKDKSPSINEMQWIQYQLDQYATVKEVISNAHSLRIAPVYAAVHYLVCDKTGECAAFEYLNQKMEISYGAKLPARTLTNNSVAESHDYVRSIQSLGGKETLPYGSGSLERYARAAAATRKAGTVKDAFSVLANVSQGDYSKWNIVYDPTTLQVYFRSLEHPKLKRTKVTAFAADCTSSPKIYDINTDDEGDISAKFRDYQASDNLALLKETTKDLKLPAMVVQIVAKFSETFSCTKPNASDKQSKTHNFR